MSYFRFYFGLIIFPYLLLPSHFPYFFESPIQSLPFLRLVSLSYSLSILICHFTQAPSFYLPRFIPLHISVSSLRLLCSLSTSPLLFNFVQSCWPFKAFLCPQPLSTSHSLSRPLNFLLTFVDPTYLASLLTSVPSCHSLTVFSHVVYLKPSLSHSLPPHPL